MKSIQLNISEKAFKRLSNDVVLKKLLPENTTISDNFLSLVIEAIREEKEEKTIDIR